MAGMKWSPEDWARLGRLIRKSRERQGFSRKRLSELSGVSEKSIQLTEEGRVPTRWPKSLDALERALDWVPGTMARVLDGFDPEEEMRDNSSTPAGGADTGVDFMVRLPDGTHHMVQAKQRSKSYAVNSSLKPTTLLWNRIFERMDVPLDIRRALPQVMDFAAACVSHGSEVWTAEAFHNSIYLMLAEVEKSNRVARGPAETVEESDALLDSLERERRTLLETTMLMEKALGLEATMLTEEQKDQARMFSEMRERLHKMGEDGDERTS